MPAPWRVTVFGAGAALAKHTIPLLHAAGCETTAFVRGSAERLPPEVRERVSRVVVGDALHDPDAVREACSGANAVVSMLTPAPWNPRFVKLLTGCTENIVRSVVEETTSSAAGAAAVGAANAAAAAAADDDAASPPPSSSSSSSRGVERLVLIGGAGVMSRSSGAFVTETLPGTAVGKVLPIYGDFFEAHVHNLQLLRDRLPQPPPPGPPGRETSAATEWVMICPGFLRDGGGGGSGSSFDDVRFWHEVNDARFRGLSVTYEDLARLVAQEAGPPTVGRGASEGMTTAGWQFRGGSRVGVESPRGYYSSIPASVLGIVRWQLQRWQEEPAAQAQGGPLPPS